MELRYNLDDMSPEAVGIPLEVYTVPISMKKPFRNFAYLHVPFQPKRGHDSAHRKKLEYDDLAAVANQQGVSLFQAAERIEKDGI